MKASTRGRTLALTFLLAPLGASSTACSSMRDQVTIRATPERVWEVLTDVEAYPEWNPFFVKVEGDLQVGSSPEVTMQPVGKEAQSFSPEVLKMEPGRCLVWRGRVLMPGLFDGEHSFLIERVDEHSVRFTQHEDFSGLFVPFVGFDPYRKGWARMNAALKRRAEEPAEPKREVSAER